MKAMTLIAYINANFDGNQSAFARHMGTSRQKVNGWISDGWIAVDHKLYSMRRDVPLPSSKKDGGERNVIDSTK